MRRTTVPLLQVVNLCAYFPLLQTLIFRMGAKKKETIVHDVSFSLDHGKTLGIVGESGCGKSTLARTLIGLHTGYEGEILWKGRPLYAQNKEKGVHFKPIQMIFQDPQASLDPLMTIGQSIAEPLEYGVYRRAHNVMEQVADMMEKVGLSTRFINRYPHEFSGGQCQRVAIARALISNPDLIICDEAVSALDVSVQSQVINLLRTLQQKMHLTIIFISHDLNVVRHISDDILVMYQGHMMEYGKVQAISQSPKHPYTRLLWSSILSLSPQSTIPKIALHNWEKIKRTQGCVFCDRCSFAEEQCYTHVPKECVTEQYRIKCHLYPSFSNKLS